MYQVSLRLSTVIVFPFPKFQIFTILPLSHSYIDYLFKFYNVIYTNAHLDTIANHLQQKI